jgi:hypothetical protein
MVINIHNNEYLYFANSKAAFSRKHDHLSGFFAQGGLAAPFRQKSTSATG